MWTAPCLQRLFLGIFDRLRPYVRPLNAVLRPLAKVGFATPVPIMPAVSVGQWIPRSFARHGSIDHAIFLPLQELVFGVSPLRPMRACRRRAEPRSRLAAGHRRRRREAALTAARPAPPCPPGRNGTARRSPSSSRQCAPSCWPAPPPPASAACAQAARQPRRGLRAAAAHLLDMGRRAHHQHLPQHLVAGPRDHPQPVLAGRRMVLRRQPSHAAKSRPDPNAAASVTLTSSSSPRPARRRASLPAAVRSRPDGDGPAASSRSRISRAVRAVFLAEHLEQLLCQRRHRRIAGNAGQQRLDMGKPLRATSPNSAAWPRIALESCVRRRTSCSRTPNSICAACCSALLIATKRVLRPAHRLADRLGVGRVVLAAPHIRLHVLRRDQHHFMAQRRQRARPVMRAAARL